jgi:signal transduction histidine kinase
MISESTQLITVFDEQLFHFSSGLIAGGFVFFTLISMSIVWFLKDPLLKLLLFFTSLQTVFVIYDFQNDDFGKFNMVKLILVALFTSLLRQYQHEIKKRLDISLTKIEDNQIFIFVSIAIIGIACLINNLFILRLLLIVYLILWLIFGYRINKILKEGHFFYTFSGFILWLYSWLVFCYIIIPSPNFLIALHKQISSIVFLGWLGVSFIAALSLIHQVVQLNAENFHLETEQLNLKNKLGFVQLESSENERKRIVSEIHNDVLNRIDMLSMVANQPKLNQENINTSLTASLKVLRSYTYKLYPPHIEILALSDIFYREAEIWKESNIQINVFFDSVWSELPQENKMPIFRFVEIVTHSVTRLTSINSANWNFAVLNNNYLLQLRFTGVFQDFYLSQENYLIYKDLLDAEINQIISDNELEISLKFKI